MVTKQLVYGVHNHLQIIMSNIEMSHYDLARLELTKTQTTLALLDQKLKAALAENPASSSIASIFGPCPDPNLTWWEYFEKVVANSEARTALMVGNQKMLAA